MFGQILNLLQGNKQRRAENARYELSRQDALAAEQRQLEYNRMATADQRRYDESRYSVERADAAADVENQFVNLRAAAEKGGFNPLAVLGVGAMPAPVSGRSGVPLVPAAQSIGYVPPTDYMGSAVAEAGLALSDAFARTSFMRNAGKLEANRDRLRRTKEAMQRDTIRPKVGGVYAQREQTRTKAEALGRTDGDRYGSPGFENSGRGTRPNADHPLVGSLGSITVPDATLDRGTGLYSGGVRLEAPPGWSSGQSIENDLGDDSPGGWLANTALFGAYVGHNAARLYDYASRADKRKPRMVRDNWKRQQDARSNLSKSGMDLGFRPTDRR
jgi:hypothetical protein